MYHIENIKAALGISAIAAEYYSWRSSISDQPAQIDLLIERADRIINVCEMKYSDAEYVLKKDEDIRLRNRVAAYRDESNSKCAIQTVLVTPYGLKQNGYSGNVSSVIVMDDLFTR